MYFIQHLTMYLIIGTTNVTEISHGFFYILPTWGSKLTIIICLYGACIKKSWQLIIRNINNISYIYISLSLEHLLMDRKKHVDIYTIWLMQFVLSIAINSAKTYVYVIMKTYTVIFGQFFCHFHSKPLYSFHYFPKKKNSSFLRSLIKLAIIE